MKKQLGIALFIITFLTLANHVTGKIISASSQDSIVKNEVVFSIPRGDNGIHYEGLNNPDTLTWGPTAFTVAQDGTFWIADTADNHLLHYNSTGNLLDKIAIGGFVVGAGDLEVTSTDIWILDMGSTPSKVVKLSLSEKDFNTYGMPEGFTQEDGTTGIALGNDGSILLEREGGIGITQFISNQGDLELKALNGYESQGKVYSFQPGNLMAENEASYGYILVGDKKIDIKVTYDLGSLGILHINSDGSFFAEVDEVVFNRSIQVDQKVYYYDSDGNLVGMARVPLASQYIPVYHSVAVGPNADVYALITKSDNAEVQRLSFSSELAPILSPPETEVNTVPPLVRLDVSEVCLRRTTILAEASDYYNNSTYLNSYHINDPDHVCTSRTKPPYLTTPNWYSSVPYAYGQADTIADFNEMMSVGSNGFFAGDIDKPNNQNCGRGVDCSGFVSNVWGLGSHYGTCNLPNISTELNDPAELKPGDIMNYCGDPGHVILFARFGNNGQGEGIWGYEATTDFNANKVYWGFRLFNTLSIYTPLKYTNVCEDAFLPHIIRSDTGMDAVDPPPGDDPDFPPYPPPPYP